MMVYELPRQTVRVIEDKESWSPSWDCYCCQDTGKVTWLNVKIIIADFNKNTDATPVCQRQGCFAGSWIHSASKEIQQSFDFRFTPEICDQLDEIERGVWKENLKLWHEMRLQNKNPLATNRTRLKAMSEQFVIQADFAAPPKKEAEPKPQLTPQEIEEKNQALKLNKEQQLKEIKQAMKAEYDKSILEAF